MLVLVSGVALRLGYTILGPVENIQPSRKKEAVRDTAQSLIPLKVDNPRAAANIR